MKPVKCLYSSAIILVILGLSFRDLRAEDITIRFIDGKTDTLLNIGHFELWGCKGLPPPKRGTVADCPDEWHWVANSDTEGKATFHLRDPLPPILSVLPAPLQTKPCTKAGWGHQDEFDTQQVLREGVVTQDEICDPKGKLKGKHSPKPGEVVIYVRRFTEWDHFLREL
jgi:hypothetical protein